MSLFGESSLFSAVNTSSGATLLAVTFLIISCIILISSITNLGLIPLFHKFVRWFMKVFSKVIHKQEAAYHRDLVIGKISEKKSRVKLYRLLSDLIIDLGWKETGLQPYELLAFVVSGCIFVTMVACKLLFDSFFMAILMSPIVIIATVCFLYTKANIAHDARIEAVIEAENIICNNIKNGTVVAVRESLNVMPKQVQGDFKDFIDNVTQKNYHIRTALLELNQALGSISDDFIKKCIVFELEEEHGIAGMFQDIVEVNNIRMEMRILMKKKFEEVMFQFKIGAGMIFIFLAAVIAIFPEVRRFYFDMAIGQIIIALDALLMILEFVYITYLRAQEL